MRTTASRSQKAAGIRRYGPDVFDTWYDWFLFVHLDRGTQAVHAISMVAGLAMFPWAMIELFAWNPLPLVLFTAVYYGSGFASHWVCDGLVSPTVPEPMKAYEGVLRLNFGWWLGTLPEEEEALLARYPFVREVYFTQQAAPETVEGM